jgi:hypothetical protein
MLTYAHVCSRSSRMLTYAHVCSRMLTYADVGEGEAGAPERSADESEAGAAERELAGQGQKTQGSRVPHLPNDGLGQAPAQVLGLLALLRV